MAHLKCAMCGSAKVLGPTALRTNANPFKLELTDVSNPGGNKEYFADVGRASACLDCGHVAMFLAEGVRKKLLEAEKLEPVWDFS